MDPWTLLLSLSCGWILASAGVVPTTSIPAATPTEDDGSRLVAWLMKFGYLPPPDASTGQLQAWTSVSRAVQDMQRFAGLPESGVLDEETTALMRSPRCSLPDQEDPSRPEGRLRRRRRTLSSWTRRNISWRLGSFPSSSQLSRETIRSLVFYALRVWAEPTPLEFHEVGGPEAADLQVDFLHGYHGDGYPFDGAGGAVGHAFFPSDPTRAGGVHLDEEEDWTFRQPASEGTDLFTVLVHESGHALGLAHSSSRHSVMRPYYQGPVGDPLQYRLGQQDLENISRLYGKRNQLLETEAPRLRTDHHRTDHHRTDHHRTDHHRTDHHRTDHHRTSSDRCNTDFDAVAKIRGETFFFRGLTMWRVGSGGLVSGRGASVRRLWRSLPPDLPPLQAVLERRSDHGIVFISGSQFWLFRDLSLQDGYPQPLSALRMGPDLDLDLDLDLDRDRDRDRDLDLDLDLDRDRDLDLDLDRDLTGDEEAGRGRFGLVWDSEEGPVWGKLEAEGPPEDTWTSLLKEGLNGITTDPDGSVYFFRGDSYWKFSSPGSAPLDGYPRSSAADWLGCPAVDDVSLSLSPAAGRPELRDGWMEEERQEHVWTRCTCQSAASRSTRMTAALLLTWTTSLALALASAPTGSQHFY